jgi:MSHA pilin protein MshC
MHTGVSIKQAPETTGITAKLVVKSTRSARIVCASSYKISSNSNCQMPLKNPPPVLPTARFVQRACAQGFTLIELIMVIVLVGVLAVAVVPNLGILKTFDDAGYRDKVRGALEYARKAAVAQRRNVEVTLAANSLTFKIANDVSDVAAGSTYPRNLALPTTDRACAAANMVCAPSGVTLTGTSSVTFSPLGRPSAAATYTVAGTSALTITVEAETGYVH